MALVVHDAKYFLLSHFITILSFRPAATIFLSFEHLSLITLRVNRHLESLYFNYSYYERAR
jgi:hypothetical protein